ncbi:MAG: gliding-associated putative ABC transporter substrate-binding component GldG [Cyclobacteriaceae bacterium]|jgi:gliding-associated putative ABC transporter substrate-binding component GldG
MNKKNIILQLVIVLAIILVANLISNSLYFRLDFTEDNRYTFSKATKDVLNELDGVITIKAYFSEDLPAQLLKSKQDFKDQLVEYENRSGGNVVFEFINPNESEEMEKEAQQQGIGPVMVNVQERDQVQQLRAYMGAVLKMEDRTEIIPLIQPGAGLEYSLTTAIKKIAITDKPKLGVIQGYGEPTPQAMGQLMEQLSVLYDVEPLNIRDTSVVPGYYRSLIWVNPTDTVDAGDFAKFDKYLNNGGGMFIAYSNVEGDLQKGLLSKTTDVGMKRWLAKRGLSIGDNFVIDASCANVNVQQRQGFFTINSQVMFPYFPQVSDFEDHAITNGLESLMLPFASNITFTAADTASSFVPLIYSSEKSGLVNPPTYIDVQKKWKDSDFNAGQQIMAAGLEKGLSRLTLITNGAFIVNGEGQKPQQLSQDNVNLAANSIDWIADDTGLIDLRTKGITSRPLEQVEDSTKLILKWGNVLAPVLLLLIYALVRMQINNKRRQRWMQGNYN